MMIRHVHHWHRDSHWSCTCKFECIACSYQYLDRDATVNTTPTVARTTTPTPVLLTVLPLRSRPLVVPRRTSTTIPSRLPLPIPYPTIGCLTTLRAIIWRVLLTARCHSKIGGKVDSLTLEARPSGSDGVFMPMQIVHLYLISVVTNYINFRCDIVLWSTF